jgi:hypothetical protein
MPLPVTKPVMGKGAATGEEPVKKAEAGVIPVSASGTALSDRFSGNLRRIYGKKAPAIGGGGKFGYMVD